MKKGIVKGATLGLFVWLVYGIVEFVLTIAIPKVWGSGSELLPWQLPLIGLLFAVYTLAGLLFGAAGGALLAWRGRGHLRASQATLAHLILIAAFLGNLIPAWPLSRSENIAMATAAALAYLFCRALFSDVWERRIAFLADPWVVSLLLLIGPWLSRQALANSSPWLKTGISLLGIMVIAAIAAVRHRILPARAGYPWKVAAAAATVVALWMGMQATSKQVAVDAQLPATTPGKPNIILITLDTVRADHLSVYGYERDTTPCLQEFAHEATVYERATADASFTLPTHASMFTGLYPSWHGAVVTKAYSEGRPLAPGTRTLAGILRRNGYWTAGVVANTSVLRVEMGLAQGFSYWDARAPASLASLPFYLRETARKLLSLFGNTTDFEVLCRRSPDINLHAFEILDKAHDGRRPFFLFLNYMDAHFPYIPPAEFRERFSAEANPRPISYFRALGNAINDGKRRLDPADGRYLTSQYDAGIALMDSELGKLFVRLRELDLYDNTLIIVTSDHGEALGEHDRMWHAMGSLYQDQLHVPLLVKYPGQHEPHRSDALVSEVDFMPTVMEAAGLPLPNGLQGQSLRSPRTQDSDFVFAEGRATGDRSANPRLRGLRRAVFNGTSKLITWTAGASELYDLASDPGELENQYRPGEPHQAALLGHLNAWTAAMPRRPSKPTGTPLDKSNMERLKSLGYIE